MHNRITDLLPKQMTVHAATELAVEHCEFTDLFFVNDWSHLPGFDGYLRGLQARASGVLARYRSRRSER